MAPCKQYFFFSETKPGAFTSLMSMYPKIHCAETNPKIFPFKIFELNSSCKPKQRQSHMKENECCYILQVYHTCFFNSVAFQLT